MRTMLAALTPWLLAAAVAHAQPAVVEAVQYPAWLERGGNAVPLTPGMVLAAQDRLRTGGNARVLLKLPEGSAVKLGENAQFVIERAEDRGVLRATLSVLAGAFRFTTDALGAQRRRDLTVKVKNVTVGIRGTDLWGKSSGDRDLVCLLEGEISVGSPGHPTVKLDKPLDFYQRVGDRAPEIARVDPAQLAEWAKETEMSSAGAAARAGGAWRMVAGVKSSRDEARALQRTLRVEGYPAEIVPKEKYFIVQVAGLVGEAEARALMARVRDYPGVALPTVHEGP